jgi:hypothetical protein
LVTLLLAGCGDSTPTSTADLGMPSGDLSTPGDMTFLANGCAPLTQPVAQPGDPIDGDTWATFAQGFFATYCTRCHSTTAVDRQGAPAGFDWDVEATVRLHLSEIRDAVGVSNFMPFLPPNPTCAERRRIVRWIDASAP